ncbi:MAG: dihydropteroate synthase [Clostridia bacterium]|nr:dihydropteroate synthase [Clostridia bacterium]
MLIIGEKLNSSIPSSLPFMEGHLSEKLEEIICRQAETGAEYLDVNAALCTDELGTMEFICKMIIDKTDCGIALDSPDASVLVRALSFCGDRKVLINSVTLSERYDEVVPVAAKLISEGRDISLIALPIDDMLPSSNEERRENIDRMISKLRADGIPDNRIFLDLITEGVATDDGAGSRFFDSLVYTAREYPDVNTTCGLSNISFGLPKRAKINTAFVAIAVHLGLTSAIIDPTSEDMRYAIRAAELLSGKDEYCMNYISLFRETT